MGEVYRAKDTRLDRTVAIKVLPAHLAANVESRQRFEREARAVSSLNYPHICALYDIGQQDGFDFLVMEYLEGETLSARLKKGALPMEQVLRYAIEIAEALDQAHRKGVFHRDLKPGNVMITKSGTKLLDFGLAKLRGAESNPVPPGLSAVPTKTEALTGKGTILGTLQYMAPEQLEGKETDARSDIFAFGAVLYEMATGRKAFEGKSAPSVMAAILERDPAPISTLQPLSPPGLDHVLKNCIAKDPDARWHGAADLAKELRWIAESGKHPAATARPLATAAASGLGSRRLPSRP
jgi:eukaryotic-like serine/threonine-protein kinase